MTEQEYVKLADQAFRRILDVFEAVDPDDADVESTGDVITISFRTKKKVVVNTQRPTRQIWLAGGARAWHFGWDAQSNQWLADKAPHEELFATLRVLAGENSVSI